MEMHDAWFFIGVFLFIFLIWIATGGPLHPIAFTGPSLAQPDVLGGGTYLQLPRAQNGVGSSNVTLPGSSNGQFLPSGTVSGVTSAPVPTFVGGSVFGTPSLYRGIVFLNHSVSSPGSPDPRNESIQVSVSQNAGLPVDLSQWTLESDASGAAVSIPRGTAIPTSGTVNAAQDIILSPGEQAIITSGQSPIGASFRENKCIGYFSTFQTFSPSLPLNCPVPSDELAKFYGPTYLRDASCIDFVNRLPRCQVSLSPPATVSGACQSFLVQYLNYNGCVAAHRNDADFNGTTWRIYLGRTNSMWRTQHELVKLLDKEGKTVDAFSY